MDYELTDQIKKAKRFKIITRNGIISSLSDLERVSAMDARSAIILANCSEMAPDDEKQNSDARVVKTVLAILSSSGDNRKKINVIAELFDERRRVMLDVFQDDNITSIDSWDILGKILVQTSMSTGLATVYDEILSFSGSDLYFLKGKGAGKKFKDLLFCFPRSVPLGVLKSDGDLLIRPSDLSMKVGKDDQILLLTKGDPSKEYRDPKEIKVKKVTIPDKKMEKVRRNHLILGWHPIASVVIKEYNDYLLEGSGVDVMINEPSERVKKKIRQIDRENPGINVKFIPKNPMRYEDLLSVGPMDYDSIIILSQSEGLHHPEKVDSDTLVILLILRKVFRSCGKDHCNTKLITQVMNSNNQDLIAKTEVDDFIISNRMITKLMAQICEDHSLMDVFREFFDETGTEIYIKSADLYFEKLPRKATFQEMLEVSLAREEICIGYGQRKYFNDPDRNFGIKLLPERNETVKIGPTDILIVLAEDEL
jgi:hypothetical protein